METKRITLYLDSDLLKNTKIAAVETDCSLEEYVSKCLLTENKKHGLFSESIVIEVKTSRVKEFKKMAYQKIDDYIDSSIKNKTIVSLSECKEEILHGSIDAFGLTGYFINKMKSLGYIKIKKRINGKSNPVNVWIKESDIYDQIKLKEQK